MGSQASQGADAASFREAWAAFATACARTVAPEATYQAWLAHFLIERTGLLRVVREVDFGARHLLADDLSIFTGSSLMVDIMILRQPLVHLPRRAALARGTLPDGTANPKSGLQRLADFAVVTELKVASSQIGGLVQRKSFGTSRSYPHCSMRPSTTTPTVLCRQLSLRSWTTTRPDG